MRKFEAMVGELNVAMWIPSQGTKDSINLELVTMDKIGGSVKKAQIAHVIMSIARSVDDINKNKATIAILKNRAGGSGQVFNNVDFNNGTTLSLQLKWLQSRQNLQRDYMKQRLNSKKRPAPHSRQQCASW